MRRKLVYASNWEPRRKDDRLIKDATPIAGPRFIGSSPMSLIENIRFQTWELADSLRPL